MPGVPSRGLRREFAFDALCAPMGPHGRAVMFDTRTRRVALPERSARRRCAVSSGDENLPTLG
ncbi:hypothetical protein HMPREF0043_00090 [Actinobaculum sp. oral taxon 183 str. F0552]|nr:hypothetical protein HMPREF0043_00090 [Actinobaculum sp. oral taxon 183 str. F0552]